MVNTKKRFSSWQSGIAMIELIFSIVIMGIVMMSAPMILSQTRKSVYIGTQQESIAAVASQVGMMFTYQWDENDTNASIGSPILTVADGDSELDRNDTINRRIGMAVNSPRSFYISAGGLLNASAMLGADAGELAIEDYDDMDDFNNTAITLTTVGGTPNASGDYIDRNINMTANIRYAVDNVNYAGSGYTFNLPAAAAANQVTNIKRITITLTTTNAASELNKNITLEAFSCNIGSYRHQERVFP